MFSRIKPIFSNVRSLSSFIHLENLKMILPEGTIKTGDLSSYTTDWTGRYNGKANIVVKPTNVTEVSNIMKYCYQNNIKVVPQGGNTGLVRGCYSSENDLIVNISNMSSVSNIDLKQGILHCEAGCILEGLNNYVGNYGYVMPLDIAAKGSCQIGGNIATNAGGTSYIQHGSLFQNVLGLEVVLANGDISNTMTYVKKNNTGYAIKNLFIGSEGTLGIITKASILLKKKYTENLTCLFGVKSINDIIDIYSYSKQILSPNLSAFEYFDDKCYKSILQNNIKLDKEYPYYILVETQSNYKEHEIEKLTKYYEYLNNKSMIYDGIIGNSENKSRKIWELRENISEQISKNRYVYKYDVSIPLVNLSKFIDSLKKRLIIGKLFTFGHIGDNNIHINIQFKKRNKEFENWIDPFIYDLVNHFNGSISAEHGIGISKRRVLKNYIDPIHLDIMKNIKKNLDPRNILNPGKIF